MSELRPTTQSKIESSKLLEILRSKKTRIPIAIAGVALALSGCAESKIDYGTPNPDATSVTIKDGAKVRNNPAVGDAATNTLLHEVKLDNISKEVTVVTLGGVYERSDADGKWFGIKATDLPNTFVAENEDADGIYWINEAKASENLIPNKTSVNPAPVAAK